MFRALESNADAAAIDVAARAIPVRYAAMKRSEFIIEQLIDRAVGSDVVVRHRRCAGHRHLFERPERWSFIAVEHDQADLRAAATAIGARRAPGDCKPPDVECVPRWRKNRAG